MQNQKNFVILLVAIFLVYIGLAALYLYGSRGEKSTAYKADELREYAGDLVNRALYEQAIESYKRYLDEFDIAPREQANINYIIADTYFDRVKDYENALAYYLKVKHLYPETSLMEEVNKKIVACLERLERSEDAQQALDESVQLDPTQVSKKRPGAVVARIGKRDVTQGDLDFELDQLPPSVREQFRSKEKKLEFLNEYVATELLYDTAKRAGLDKNAEVIEGAFQAKKMIMVRRLLEDRVASKVEIKEDDVELYYEANKDDYAEKDDEGNVIKENPLSAVRDKVAQDLYLQKYQNAYQDLIQKMILAEDVKFYTDRVQ